MTTPKPLSAEEIAASLFGTIFGGTFPKEGAKPTAAAPTVDNVAEINRLLKKAEEASSPSEAGTLLQIADRHLRIVDLALSSQR